MVVCGLTKKLECVQDWSYPAQNTFDYNDKNWKVFKETILNDLNKKSMVVYGYGTKSSGKTYTLFGSDADQGLVQRSIKESGNGFKVSVMQIFKTGIYDVLKTLKDH